MRKLIFISFLALSVVLLFTSFGYCKEMIMTDGGGGGPSGGDNDPPAINHAPVFDQLNPYFVGRFQNDVVIPFGITDEDLDEITVAVTGMPLGSQYNIDNNVPGRLDGSIILNTAESGRYTINLTANDAELAKGSFASFTVDIIGEMTGGYTFGIFGPIENVVVPVSRKVTLPITVVASGPEYLNNLFAVGLPNFVQVVEYNLNQRRGQMALEINPTSAGDAGDYNIQLLAQSGSLISVATLRIRVPAPSPALAYLIIQQQTIANQITVQGCIIGGTQPQTCCASAPVRNVCLIQIAQLLAQYNDLTTQINSLTTQNRPPLFSPLSSVFLQEQPGNTAIPFSITDEDGDDLQVSISGLPLGSTYSVNYSPGMASGQLLIDTSNSGAYYINYFVKDNRGNYATARSFLYIGGEMPSLSFVGLQDVELDIGETQSFPITLLGSSGYWLDLFVTGLPDFVQVTNFSQVPNMTTFTLLVHPTQESDVGYYILGLQGIDNTFSTDYSSVASIEIKVNP